MYAAVANGAKSITLLLIRGLICADSICRGLVVLGPGAASLSSGATAAAAELMKAGIPVVAAPRPVTGAGPPGLTTTGV